MIIAGRSREADGSPIHGEWGVAEKTKVGDKVLYTEYEPHEPQLGLCRLQNLRLDDTIKGMQGALEIDKNAKWKLEKSGEARI
jgi:hypothetical protein